MSVLQQRPDVSEFRRRFKWLALFQLLCFGVLVGRLFQLQLVQAEDYQAIARENIVRRVTLATTRGIIRDRFGKPLAASRPAYNLYVTPKRVTKVDKEGQPPVMTPVWAKLVAYLNLGDEEVGRLEQKLVAIVAEGGKRKDQQILLKEDISFDDVAVLSTHAHELPGIDVVDVSVRFYPQKSVGAHALGYMREVDPEMLAEMRRQGYVEGDHVGASGIERSWESYLRGTRGWEKVIVDARGARRPMRPGIIDGPSRVDPIPGRDLRLSLDADVQAAIERAMRGELAGGAALVDVESGQILGLVSKPGYDPNQLSGGSGKGVVRDAFQRMFSDQLKPALDKTVSGAYPPGSTWKPFTALAALEKGLIDKNVRTVCRGFLTFGKRVFKCTQAHGSCDLHRAIAASCNVYFYQLVATYGVTMDMIAEVGGRYGFGRRTGIGINAEASGRMPTKAWMTLRNKGQFRQGYTVNAAIGQGATTVTVLQLALAYAALANGGTLYQPQIVQAVETAGGDVVQEFQPRVRRKTNLDPKFRTLVHQALLSGVTEIGGTAYQTWRQLGVDVAGKTGTAQVSHKATGSADLERVYYFNRDHAWFAGYAPTTKPEVAVVVLIEHGGGGSKHAAPVALNIVRAWEDLKRKRAGERPRPLEVTP